MARKKQAEAVVEEEVMPEAGVDLNEMAAGALADPAVQALLKDRDDESDSEEDSFEPPEVPKKNTKATKEQDSEGSDADDEPQLDDQLAELAARYNISPDLVEGAESLSEAQRFIDRYFKVMYREGESANFAPPMPQPEPPAKKSPVPEIDLSEYDDDDPIAKNFKALKGELDALKAEREQAQLAEFHRQQQEAAYHFGQALRKSAPELFGTDKKQDARQARNEREAFEAGNILVRGFASSGQRMPPLDVLAEQVLRMSFSDELKHKKATAKKEAIQDRVQRRSIGTPSRKSTSSGLNTKEVYQGSAADDPELKRIINNKWSQLTG